MKSVEAGCEGHLVKPVSLPDLEEALGQVGQREAPAARPPAERRGEVLG